MFGKIINYMPDTSIPLSGDHSRPIVGCSHRAFEKKHPIGAACYRASTHNARQQAAPIRLLKKKNARQQVAPIGRLKKVPDSKQPLSGDWKNGGEGKRSNFGGARI